MKQRKRTRQLDNVTRPRSLVRRPRGRAAAPVPMDDAVRRRVERRRVAEADLRWRCDPRQFEFRTTRALSAGSPFVGQRKALQTLKMGLSMKSPGYNLFLCGLGGDRKLARLADWIRKAWKRRDRAPDRCYVQNFSDPQRPRLLEVPAGRGYRLQADVAMLLNQLHDTLENKPPKSWRRLARQVLEARLPVLQKRYRFEEVSRWLHEWSRVLLGAIRSVNVEDFEVNCLGQPGGRSGPVVVTENVPAHANLFGWIGRRPTGSEQNPAPHFTEIRRGSFLEADGGVLLLDAADLCTTPGAWATLRSTLKYGQLAIQDGDPSAPARSGVLKPEPIPVDVKVVLVGDYSLYEFLYESDPDFSDLFKLRVDFETEVDLTSRILRREYPSLIAGISQREGLRSVAASGVARVVEQAVRHAGRKKKIAIQSSMVADLLREADYWAGRDHRRSITARDVDRAVSGAIDRVNLVEKKIAEMISDGTILIATGGSRVGQVNGLAIYDMGDYFFGKPSRITCETSVGQSGIINIERESGFSGRSHDKGVQILAGYLRSCFAQNRPLSLTASVCFEQSYSGIDGDSASSTEIYAILSSLSGLPIRQDLAVTGSLSQKGDVQPIGGVNEKVEGFFDCVRMGRMGRPTGTEGVIIPRKNIVDLMLRPDVVAAVEKGRFHIYAVDDVRQAIEILTGRPAGRRGKKGTYPEGSVFRLVDERLEELASTLRRYGEGD